MSDQESGEVVPLDGGEVPEHYHVEYYFGDPADEPNNYEFGWGHTVLVDGNRFLVEDFDTCEIIFTGANINEAVKWCYDQYQAGNPGKIIRPVWGAGAPNRALKELGYECPWEMTSGN